MASYRFVDEEPAKPSYRFVDEEEPKQEGSALPRPVRQAATWANQAIAGVPDAVLNTPTNVWNLAKAGVGTIAAASGRPDLAPEMTPVPNYVTRAFEAVHGIEPGMDPTTLPGRLAKAGVQGGVVGAFAPAQSLGQVALNSGISAASSTAGQATTEATDRPLLGAAVNMASVPVISAGVNAARDASMKAQSRNSMKDQTLRDANEEGFVTPPSASGGNWFTRRLESVAGKAAIGQESAVRNQEVANKIARRETGLPEDSAISVAALDKRRDVLAAPYREVRALNKNAAADLEALREARRQSNLYYRHYDVSQDPKALATAESNAQQAAALESRIEGYAKQAMKPDLVKELREARTSIAKTYDVERALNVATGDVSLPVLGRIVDKGKPLTGGLGVAGKFQQAFPSYAREGAKVQTPGVSKSEALASALLGVGGYGAMGPYGAAMAALPLASGPVRSMLLTSPFQGPSGYLPAGLPAVSDPYLRGILSTNQMLRE
jgi:hypothetical protein